ncbi:mannose-6-phosphate isomerase [Novosphingobium sp. Rr 2-17]|uniref:AGE family epimerase/isomerase n=1 Tax=Novosphingobium sp. Rr 2-17 TaxID=555793 RepID=UPI000269ABD1|nr:AGE family epimerase/isomerase [Novosphingobium sp. Rr 2-17]EIZ77186.1 mannose-6-phosphate isomerase [Novosphingobium sp. Rr 2-17]
MTPTAPAFWTDWLCRFALPLWSEAGLDDNSFVERLALDGTPQPDVPRRVMVQARQIHVFATAARKGWFPGGADLALRAGETMIARYWQAGGQPGWAFSCTRAGSVVDNRRDFYAHSFVLLALAAMIRLDAAPRTVALVRRTLAFLDDTLAHPAGGYAEAWPCSVLPRRQNPHMHLLESLLALQETGLCGDFGPRIAAMIELFDTRFLSAGDDVLTEDYDADWMPVNPDGAFEPGHHFEWVWLLTRTAALTGITVEDRVARLLRRGLYGIDASARVIDRMGLNGPIAESCRLWPAMEAAKVLTGTARERVLEAAWHTFFAPAHPGGWIDHVDARGTPLTAYMPASSLYHIGTALDHLGGG